MENPIIDMTTNQYILHSSVPSISEVKLNGNNVSEYILYLGADENFFYYNKKSTIEEIINDLNWTKSDICLQNKPYYPSKVESLLKTTKLKYIKKEKINKKNALFISDYNSFKIFCKKEDENITLEKDNDK